MNRWLLSVSLAAAVWPTAAAAQDGDFSVQRFTVAPGSHNYFGVDGARVSGHMAPSVGLTLDYAREPLVVVTCSSESDCDLNSTETALVEDLVTAQLHGALTLVDYVQLGLVLPVAISSGQEVRFGSDRGDAVGGGTGGGLGDPEISAKVRLFDGGPDGFDLAASAFLTLPLGQATAGGHYVGDDNVTAGGQGIAGYVVGDLHFAVNVGAVWREKQTLLTTTAGPAMTYGVGVGYDVTSDVTVLGELDGGSRLSSQVDENPLEGRLGARMRVDDFVLSFGIGAGLVSGLGVPLVRVLGGAAWRPRWTDADGDGVEDAQDECPDEAEDMDGFEDGDGCPEADNDGDGMADAADRCPDEAEDMDGFEDEDGCPDPDNDGDGVPDGYDSCPSEPEDKDGDRDDDGCPEEDRAPDSDLDGVPDDEDECPDVAEDTDGLADEDGCPEEDADGDGVTDIEDRCPLEPGDAENRGCAPDSPTGP